MKTNLLHNKEIEDLTHETDFLNHLPKAKAIKEFIETNSESLGDNKMFVLYGEWGSGKSTIMKYVAKELSVGKKYHSIFFRAWEHEKDENLALSLVDVIANQIADKGLGADLLSTAFVALKNLGKGITIKTPFFDFDFDKTIDGTETEIKKATQEISTYTKIQLLKQSFKNSEEILCIEKEKEKIIVFIDDLDRCEPENVLTLISAIKLFFTLGHKTIFFFGVDKKAVGQAVRTRYDDVVHSEVYLEKVFDISFHVPTEFKIHRLLAHYFPSTNGIPHSSIFTLESFFKKINFTNPRHIKKVLNKYEIIKAFRNHGNYVTLIPHNIIIDSGGDPMETIFVLFFIILFEFENKNFLELENYEEKLSYYAKAYMLLNNKKIDRPQDRRNLDNAKINVIVNSLGANFEEITLKMIAEFSNKGIQDSSRFKKVLILFTPFNVKELDYALDSDIAFIEQFEIDKENMLVNFCKFLIEQRSLLANMNSTYKFSSFFEMANTLL